MKFTAYEAEGIQALVATSPLMSWMYKVFSLQATSNIIGVAEITAALLMAIQPLWARLSVLLRAAFLDPVNRYRLARADNRMVMS